MKTFEELQECVYIINRMEEIFKDIAILAHHKTQIEKFITLKDRVFELLVKDVERVAGL